MVRLSTFEDGNRTRNENRHIYVKRSGRGQRVREWVFQLQKSLNKQINDGRKTKKTPISCGKRGGADIFIAIHVGGNQNAQCQQIEKYCCKIVDKFMQKTLNNMHKELNETTK